MYLTRKIDRYPACFSRHSCGTRSVQVRNSEGLSTSTGQALACRESGANLTLILS
jgi:hypothetical protein